MQPVKNKYISEDLLKTYIARPHLLVAVIHDQSYKVNCRCIALEYLGKYSAFTPPHFEILKMYSSESHCQELIESALMGLMVHRKKEEVKDFLASLKYQDQMLCYALLEVRGH